MFCSQKQTICEGSIFPHHVTLNTSRAPRLIVAAIRVKVNMTNRSAHSQTESREASSISVNVIDKDGVRRVKSDYPIGLCEMWLSRVQTWKKKLIHKKNVPIEV